MKRLKPVALPGGGDVAGELTATEVRIRVRLEDVSTDDAQELLRQIAVHLS